jgi:hypothetical protein
MATLKEMLAMVGEGVEIRQNMSTPESYVIRGRVERSSPMTQDDAVAEAKRRWGDAGIAGQTPRGSCSVGVNTNPLWPPDWRGDGASFEEAFAQADLTEKKRGTARVASRQQTSARTAPMTAEEANLEAYWRWGPHGEAAEVQWLDSADICCVGIAGEMNWRGKGRTFEEAFSKAEQATANKYEAQQHPPPSPVDIRAANRQAADRIIAACPEWAYPTAWRLAVMAHIEEHNNREAPIRYDPTELGLELAMNRYHAARLRGLTVANAVTETQRYASTNGMDGVDRICKAYERGRR